MSAPCPLRTKEGQPLLATVSWACRKHTRASASSVHSPKSNARIWKGMRDIRTRITALITCGTRGLSAARHAPLERHRRHFLGAVFLAARCCGHGCWIARPGCGGGLLYCGESAALSQRRIRIWFSHVNLEMKVNLGKEIAKE